MSSTADLRRGGCLCGAVRYRTPLVDDAVLQCHCENCRRLSGNFVAAVRSNTADLELTDPDRAFAWYDLDYARYGFCRRCGATLFFAPAEPPSQISVMVGSLDDASGLRLESVWFAAEAQPHNPLPNVTLHARNG